MPNGLKIITEGIFCCDKIKIFGFQDEDIFIINHDIMSKFFLIIKV